MQHEEVMQRYSGVTLQQLTGISRELVNHYPDQKIWLFHGDMGAGKTSIIKEICRQLEVNENMSSPTFTLVNEYLDKNGAKIFHFDFYRLKSEKEAFEIGVEEYFYSGNYCFIEWPEKVKSLLPAEHIDIAIKVEDPDHRTIEVTINAS
jgi:tRNA threonylcarbamoyladenosine biosynthesis protein TsaE